MSLQVRESVAIGERAELALHPWASYVVVPLFALSAAGIPLSTESFDLGSRVFLGVLLGLVVGKLVGIALFSWIAVRIGVARLPGDVRWGNVVGVAAIAGIGFTVSLFIAALAFDDQQLVDEAKMAVLVASIVAAVLGAGLAIVAGSRRTLEPAVGRSARPGVHHRDEGGLKVGSEACRVPLGFDRRGRRGARRGRAVGCSTARAGRPAPCAPPRRGTGRGCGPARRRRCGRAGWPPASSPPGTETRTTWARLWSLLRMTPSRPTLSDSLTMTVSASGPSATWVTSLLLISGTMVPALFWFHVWANCVAEG